MEIGRFVTLVNNDKTKVVNWGEKGRTWANNDLWSSGIEDLLPDKVAFGLGLTGVDEDNFLAKSGFKNPNKLAG